MNISPNDLIVKARDVLSIMEIYPPVYDQMPHIKYTTLPGIVEDLIALAERQREMLVEATARGNAAKHQIALLVHPLAVEPTFRIIESHVSDFRAQARKELSIQKRSRFSELERDAIEHAISSLDQWSDSLEDEMAIKVLRKMLEE